MLLQLVLMLLALLGFVGVSANESHDRRMKARKNFKGEKVGHSNYGRSFEERMKLVNERFPTRIGLDNAQPDKQNEDTTDFMYFKMHDRDGNDMLDGTELVRMMLEDESAEEYDEYLLKLMLEHLLEEDDQNNDGYIDWPEFKKSEKQHAEPF